jgi:hypothetical protein
LLGLLYQGAVVLFEERTYRDSLSSRRPNTEESPASLISGEKLILQPIHQPSISGALSKEGSLLIHTFLLTHVMFFHFLEHLSFLRYGFHRIRFEPDIYFHFG